MTEDDLYHNKRINYPAYSCISQARYNTGDLYKYAYRSAARILTILVKRPMQPYFLFIYFPGAGCIKGV